MTFLSIVCAEAMYQYASSKCERDSDMIILGNAKLLNIQMPTLKLEQVTVKR